MICPNHPPAETLVQIACSECGAWKPTSDSPLVYIGRDGVHTLVRETPTTPAPPPDDVDAFELALRAEGFTAEGTNAPSALAIALVEKRSFPDQEKAPPATAENKGDVAAKSPPLLDQCRAIAFLGEPHASPAVFCSLSRGHAGAHQVVFRADEWIEP